jgi:hypothetical protein
MNPQVIGRVKLVRVKLEPHPTMGATMTLARYFAKRAIKEQWQRQGLKPHHIAASHLNQAADAYLNQHREELIERACAVLIKPKR